MQTVLVLEVRDIPQGPLEKLEILYMLEAEEVVEFHAAILALEVQAEEVQTVLYARMDVRTLFELTDTEKEELLQLIDKPLKKIPYGFSNISGSGYLIFVNSSGERAWLSVRSVPYYEEKAYWKDTELGPVAFVDGEPRYYWVSSVLGSPYSNEEIQGEQVEELIHACEIRAQLAHAKETVSPEMLEELEEQKKRQRADLQ